ncbi:hypothetical protein JCM19053_3702 [Vibrio sp. JCM 19053]|nr:hypothetical protein JCM19053_3702 [Vibrio sp. JCM 19053]
MNLFLPLGVKYWPVLVKTFAGCFLVRKQSPHLMARILTNLLQKKLAQSFGISKIIAKKVVL